MRANDREEDNVSSLFGDLGPLGRFLLYESSPSSLPTLFRSSDPSRPPNPDYYFAGSLPMQRHTRLEALQYLYRHDSSTTTLPSHLEWLLQLPSDAPESASVTYLVYLAEVRRLRHSILGAVGFQQKSAWDLVWKRINAESGWRGVGDREKVKAWDAVLRGIRAPGERQRIADQFAMLAEDNRDR